MPIIIQDLLASDTISQAADKINFNFDQIILNGGGAPGPRGLPGPTGPAGGRGLRGATWYKDTTSAPGVSPNSIIIPNLNNDDLYLQADGQIWTYNGTVWVEGSINLTGPQGEAGSGVGFAYVGGFPGIYSIANENVAFPIIMPSGSGATQNNQGVSTVMIGAVGGEVNPPTATPPITFDSSFKISDAMAKQLDSSLVSLLIHQKDLTSSAIRFMGGGEQAADKYEQADLQKLTNITLGLDDSFDINVPKASTSPESLSNLIGFNLNTEKKGQQFRAGKYITFISGTDSELSGFGGELSHVTFNINTSNPAIPAKFSVDTVGANGGLTAKFEIGGSISLPGNAVGQTGTGLTLANVIHLVGNQVELKRNATNGIKILNTGILIQTGEGPLNLNTTSNRLINITGSGSVNIESATAVNIESAGGINIIGDTDVTGELEVSSDTTVNGKLNLNDVETGTGEILVVSTSGEVQKTSNFANASIPIGGIIMWSGGSIPAGFVLCDGQFANGTQTPDLRGRFIVGQDPRAFPGGDIWDINYNDIGNIGGEKEVTLTVGQLPEHSHKISGRSHQRNTSGAGERRNYVKLDAYSPSENGESVTSAIGEDEAHENRPPYYVLAFIMYVGV